MNTTQNAECYAAPVAETVIRYVVTIRNGHGLRVLFDARQGRYTYETEAVAQERCDIFRTSDIASRSNIDQVFRYQGAHETLEVRPCRCYAGHFDPIDNYFAPEVRCTHLSPLTGDQCLKAAGHPGSHRAFVI